MINWKGFGRTWSWPNFKLLSWHFPEGTEKNQATKDVSQDSRSPERDLNPKLPEYEEEVLSIRPRRSVETPYKLLSNA
jgi:hypothetical protein